MNNYICYKKNNIENFLSMAPPPAPPPAPPTAPPTTPLPTPVKPLPQYQILPEPPIDTLPPPPIDILPPPPIDTLPNNSAFETSSYNIKMNIITFLNNLGQSIPNNILNMINSNDNSPPNLSILSDIDNNYLLNILKNFFLQKNAFLNKIKEAIDNSYKMDNTILNLYNDSNRTRNLIAIITNAYLNNINNYNILQKIIPPSFILYLSFPLNLLQLQNISLDKNSIDCLFGLLQNIEIIIIVIISLKNYIEKSNNKEIMSQAIDNLKNIIIIKSPINVIQNRIVEFKNLFHTSIIKPYLSTQCSDNNCSAFYNSFVIQSPVLLQQWLLNQNVKNQLMNIFKINYNSILAICNLIDNLLTLDISILSDIQMYENTTDINLQKNLISRVFIDHIIKNLNITFNILNKSSEESSFGIGNKFGINEQLITGVPNLYLYIGIFIILLLLFFSMNNK